MVTEGEAKKLVGMFKGMPGYPKLDYDKLKLAKAIRETAANADHARRAIESLLDAKRACPPVEDLTAAIRSMPVRPTATKRVACNLCGGTGFRTVFALVTFRGERKTHQRLSEAEYRQMWKDPRYHQLGRQQLYDAAEECSCRKPARRPASSETGDQSFADEELA